MVRAHATRRRRRSFQIARRTRAVSTRAPTRVRPSDRPITRRDRPRPATDRRTPIAIGSAIGSDRTRARARRLGDPNRGSEDARRVDETTSETRTGRGGVLPCVVSRRTAQRWKGHHGVVRASRGVASRGGRRPYDPFRYARASSDGGGADEREDASGARQTRRTRSAGRGETRETRGRRRTSRARSEVRERTKRERNESADQSSPGEFRRRGRRRREKMGALVRVPGASRVVAGRFGIGLIGSDGD